VRFREQLVAAFPECQQLYVLSQLQLDRQRQQQQREQHARRVFRLLQHDILDKVTSMVKSMYLQKGRMTFP
jgi:hypothetical protein